MITLINGQTIRHSNERSGFWDMASKGKWEPETFIIIDRFVKPDSIFLDIGAWNGICSLYAEQLGARCYAIEPDAVAFKELLGNIKASNSYIIPLYMCVSDSEESKFLYSQTSNGFGNSESSLLLRGIAKARNVVQGITLEKLIEDQKIDTSKISLIKMDIEGAEIMVLPQAHEFLKKHRIPLYISFHPGWFPDRDKNIQDIIKVIFDVYDVKDCLGNEYTPELFIKALDAGQHTFILT